MDWQFIKDLFWGVFWSPNSIATWIGVVSSVFFFFPVWEGKMKDTIKPYRITILLGFILISVMLTSYSLYENKPTVQNAKTDTKQDIRFLLESINPEILQKIDTKQKEIRILISIPNEVELKGLSKRPDFNKFLSFKQCQCGDIKDSNSYVKNYINELNDDSWRVGYCLYPKDALIK
jgi:hypothetical protein